MKIINLKEEEKKIIFTVESSQEEFEKVHRSQLLNISKNIKISGFRKGFVPLEIAENYINKKNLFEKICKKLIFKFEKEIYESQSDFSKKMFDCSVENKVENFDEKTKIIKFTFVFEKIPTVKIGDYSKIFTFYEKKQENDLFWVKEKEGNSTKDDIVLISMVGKNKDKKFISKYFYDYLEIDLSNSKIDHKILDCLIGVKFKDKKELKIEDKDQEIFLEIIIFSVKEKVKITKMLIEELGMKEFSTEDDLKVFLKKEIHNYNEIFESKEVIKWILSDQNKLDFVPLDSLKIKSTEILLSQKKNKNFDSSKEGEIFNKILNENFNSLKMSVVLDEIAKIENFSATDADKADFLKDVEKKPWLYRGKKPEDFFSESESDINQYVIQFKTISFLKDKLFFSN